MNFGINCCRHPGSELRTCIKVLNADLRETERHDASVRCVTTASAGMGIPITKKKVLAAHGKSK